MFHRSVSAPRLGRLLACLSLLVCYHGIAQDNVAPKSLRVTHILGLQGLKDNTNGTLTIQAHTLRFQPHDGNAAEIMVSSIREVALGVQDKEVGGMPLEIGRAATPFGGGRVIALFAHKKYDIVTVKYRDSDGGFHGAIFQLNKGEAQVLKSELEAGGAQVIEVDKSAEALSILASSPSQLFAGNHPPVAKWDLQVDTVESGDVNIGPDFKVAIYENLLKELAKTERFGRVFRDGDRNAHGVHNLLILKTTVESYTPGSEAKRAVTTVAGATKLKVLSKLGAPDDQIVLERSVTGNVRFFGGNLRATHNLAHNVAKAIEQSTLGSAR